MSLDPRLGALAWALLHFLWQGLLLWLLALAAFRLARRPQTRYALGLAFLGLALACPLATGWLLRPRQLPALPGPGELGPVLAALPAGFPKAGPGSAMAPFLPWVVRIWALGASLLALRLAGGWLWLQRLKARMAPLEEDWERRLRELARRMGLRRAFRAGVSDRIRTPLVIGWIRPVLLVPAGLFTGLDPLALEALLAHEVAHLRRHDVLFNWMQCAVEVLLFYHPAVWWLSKRVRLERECCCDDAAVALSGDPLRYAETLDRLDDLLDLSPAQAATGGQLMFRITRLLSPKPAAPRAPLALPLLALLAAGALALPVRSQDPKPAAAPSAAAPTPGPSPAPKARPASKPSSAPKAAPEATPAPSPQELNPRIFFEVHFSKDAGPKLTLQVMDATRAQAEEALARIESVVPAEAQAQQERPAIKGSWTLSRIKADTPGLLNFRLEQVTFAEAHKLF